MRLLELFLDDGVGPFCIVEWAVEAEGLIQFAFRFVVMVVIGIPMFALIAPFWLLWQVLK